MSKDTNDSVAAFMTDGINTSIKHTAATINKLLKEVREVDIPTTRANMHESAEKLNKLADRIIEEAVYLKTSCCKGIMTAQALRFDKLTIKEKE